MNSSIPCLYNPYTTDEVITELQDSHQVVLFTVIFPFLVAFIGLVGLIYTGVWKGFQNMLFTPAEHHNADEDEWT